MFSNRIATDYRSPSMRPLGQNYYFQNNAGPQQYVSQPQFVQNYQPMKMNTRQHTPNMVPYRENKENYTAYQSNFGAYDRIQMTCFVGKYEVKQSIGKGSYAEVFLGQSSSGESVAVKVYQKHTLKSDILTNLINEIQVMKILRHDHIVKFKDVYQTDTTVNLVMNYCGQLSLYSQLKSQKHLPKDKSLQYLKQLLHLLQYLHHLGVAHRDVKLENILIQHDNLYLIDLGFSTFTDTFSRVFCGTPSYMAPEILTKQQYDSKKSDIWSAGIILAAMVQGAFPFKGKTERELFSKIKAG